MTDLPTGIVTFLFTDIEGSTRLWEQHPEAMEAALARHDALLRQAIQAHGGRVFKTIGDQFCAVFGTVAAALAAVLAAQQALRAEPWPSSTPLRIRTALYTGTARSRDEDYFGPAVNRVARLLAVGHGDQILLSAATAGALRAALPEGASLRDLGAHRLKDLQQPEHLFQLLSPGLPTEFPPLRSLEAFAHNLPSQLTSFIGRELQMAEVKQWLTTTRLVTLTGGGGCGKTRLALQVAADLLEEYADGVWLVELAPLEDPALVRQTVASALGVREEPGHLLTATLTEYLRPKSLLLLLDNCEHLLPACAQLAEGLLRACPKLRVLASSREALGIRGERTYRVPSFIVPDPELLPPLARLCEFEAVQLFADRARLSQPTFAVTQANAASVVQVCQRLDGIPLALELAAARVKALPVEKLNERLDDMFRLLTGGSRTALPRQQTLRALIDWSYDLLSPPEKGLLRRLSVFVGGWTLEAAEAVCVGEGVEEWEVLGLLTSLVEKSLALYEEQAGEGRYHLLETMRQYARDRLLETGEAERVRERHATYLLALAEEAATEFTRSVRAAWLDRLEIEYENLRAALTWSFTAGSGAETGLRLARALLQFWQVRGYLSEGRAYLEQALGREGAGQPTRERADALNAAAVLAWMQGDAGASRALFDESLAIEQITGEPWETAWSIYHLGHVVAEQGDYQKAKGLLEESLAIFRQLEHPSGIAASLVEQASVALKQGELEAARSLYEEGLRISRELGNKVSIAIALNNLGKIAREQGDTQAARDLHTEGLMIRLELGDRGGYPWSPEAFARLAAPENPERAARLWGAAEVLRETLGWPLPPSERAEYDRAVCVVREALGKEAFATAWSEGRAMTEAQATAYAVEESV
jgi:predicted ATPase/class 3 adenylate cyclase